MEGDTVKAARVLRAAWEAGINVQAEGGCLLLDAKSPPPNQVIDNLTLHKADILILLTKQQNGWSKADWLKFYLDRAEAAETREGWDLARASLIAFEMCVERWRVVNHSTQSMTNQCPHCGHTIKHTDLVVPVARACTGIGRLHASCADGWRQNTIWQARKAMLWLIHPHDVRSLDAKGDEQAFDKSIA